MGLVRVGAQLPGPIGDALWGLFMGGGGGGGGGGGEWGSEQLARRADSAASDWVVREPPAKGAAASCRCCLHVLVGVGLLFT